MGELSEPPRAQTGEECALVRDRLLEDDVEGRQAVGGDEEQVAIVDLVRLAHLAAMHEPQPLEVRRGQGHVVSSLSVSASFAWRSGRPG